MNKQEYQYKNITTNTTTQVFVGRGLLRSIVIGTTAAGSITITDTDGTTSNGNIGILKASIVEGTYRYDVSVSRGLSIVTAGSSDITVCWAQG